MAARAGGVSAHVRITSTPVTPKANTQPRSFEVQVREESVPRRSLES